MVFGEDHDYQKYPELSNKQISEFGFVSPHVQIDFDFTAEVIKVSDGDTITLRTDFRDFDFPLRFRSIDAPELNTGQPGQDSKEFLKDMIEGEQVDIKMDRWNRVGKFGRLLGDVVSGGVNVGEIMLGLGLATTFARRREGEIESIEKQLGLKKFGS